MLKKLTVFLLPSVFITGCNAMGPALAQKITLPNGKPGYSIDCTLYSGWPACFEVAGNVCKAGYRIHERSMDEFSKSNIPVEPLEVENSNMHPAQPPGIQAERKKNYMIISCK